MRLTGGQAIANHLIKASSARYQRQLADLPLGGRRVRVVAHIRRFKCVNPRCAQCTFSEQIPGLAGY